MKVYITRKLPDAAIQYLKDKGIKVSHYLLDKPIPRNLLLQKVKNIDALIPLLTDKIDKEVINQMNKCRIIANYAVGYDNIDVDYAASKNIIVTNISYPVVPKGRDEIRVQISAVHTKADIDKLVKAFSEEKVFSVSA